MFVVGGAVLALFKGFKSYNEEHLISNWNLKEDLASVHSCGVISDHRHIPYIHYPDKKSVKLEQGVEGEQLLGLLEIMGQ